MPNGERQGNGNTQLNSERNEFNKRVSKLAYMGEPKELLGTIEEEIVPYNNLPSTSVGRGVWLNLARSTNRTCSGTCNTYDREKQKGQTSHRFESCLG